MSTSTAAVWVLTCPDPEGWARRIAQYSAATTSGCIRWSGPLDRHGYGKFRYYGRFIGAHRAAWLALRGDIPDRMVIDHLCRNRACVNVDHMEVVTNAVNSLRANHDGKRGRSGKRKDAPLHHCGQHGREDGYLHNGADGYTRWVCRICRRESVARYRARSRA